MSSDIIEGELVDMRDSPGALALVTEAEISSQIRAAQRMPRSPDKFLKQAISLVSISPEIAAQCRYSLPARAGGGGKKVEGPSVRLAEICALAWRNLRIVGRITDDDGKFVTAQGVGLDLESNVAYSIEVKRGITTKQGRRYGDDMVKTTMLAAISIATRNVTFKCIPKAFVSQVEEEAARVARGDVKTLPDRTRKALDYFKSKGAREQQVFQALGIGGPADMTLDHLMTLQGFRTAVQEGHATAEELFAPKVVVEQPGMTRSQQLAQQLRPAVAIEGGIYPGPSDEGETTKDLLDDVVEYEREPGEDG